MDPQRQAKGGMLSGLMTSHCVMIVPNSLLKVRKVVIVHGKYLLRCSVSNEKVSVLVKMKAW